MKKAILLILFTWALSWTMTQAQSVAAFGFHSEIGIYEEISDGTVVGQGLKDNELENRVFFDTGIGSTELITAAGFPIGFTFSFNNLYMDRFAIGSHGYIVLGKNSVTVDPDRSSFMLLDNGEGKNNIIGVGIFTDIKGLDDTEISYKLINSPPDRVLIVQFKNLGMTAGSPAVTLKTDLQIRLEENTGDIKLIFRNWENENGSKVARVGIKGSMKEDMHVRYSSTNDWQNTQKSTSDRTFSWAPGQWPVDGLTYTFTSPSLCETPISQPTSLSLNASTTAIEGSFQPSTNTDHYLVVMTKEAALTSSPVNGVFYEEEATLGNGTVISYSANTTFETSVELDGATNYYFHVFAANSECAFGPVYNLQNPLTAAIQTLPAAPLLIEEVEVEYHSIVLKVASNSMNDNIIIGVTEEPLISYGSVTRGGIFGVPEGELTIGDNIEGGGTVIYKGPSTEAFKIEELKANTIYHFKAWSVNKENNYSTTAVETDVLTWGEIPYESIFDKMPAFDAPFGWETEGTIYRISSGQLECNIQTANANGGVHAVTTQWILLGEASHRLLMDYRMTTWTRATGDLPYNEWDERDVMEIQISKDGNNFTTIYKIDKDNAPQLESISSWVNLKLSFDEYKNEKVKLRIYWKTYQAVKLIIDNLLIEEYPACDYPINLTVDESLLTGTNALVAWEATGEEGNWDIRYRKTDMQEWDYINDVNTNPYLITALPARSEIELQVRAKCSMTSHSEWSKSIIFNTGYTLPFTQSFEDNGLPLGWNIETGIIDNPTVFCIGNFCDRKWDIKDQALHTDFSQTLNDWIILPIIDLEDEEVNYKLAIDTERTNGAGNSDEDSYLAIVIADEEGNFSKDNILERYLITTIPIDSLISWKIPLNDYRGKVRMAIYAENTNTSSDRIAIKTISVIESCPMDLTINVEDVTENSAKISWEGDATEWFTFVRKAGEENKNYQPQTETEITLTNLSPRTTYEVGITKECSENDRAKVIITSFTTLPDSRCQLVEEIDIEVTPYEAIITWQGEAEKYNIQVRETGKEDWLITTTTPNNAITIDGLSPGTEYEYTIQSICSNAIGDNSEWLPIDQFTTHSVTCFVPDKIEIKAITHISATISWEGDAEKYEIAYRKGNEEWTNPLLVNEKGYLIENLEPKTSYTVRVRSVCADNDISMWSSVYELTTTAIPDCAIPINLQVSGITESTATLNWEADESNVSWDLRYRQGSVTSWNTINDLNQTSYLLENLSPNTAYLWSVRASCDEERQSTWAAQENFTTQEGLGIVTYENKWNVFITNNIINILNPNQIRIEYVRIYHLDGQLMSEFQIRSNENIFIPYDTEQSVIIIKIYTESFTEIHKGLVR